MRVGDLVKHRYGTLQGTGVVLSVRVLSIRHIGGKAVRALWTSHGRTIIHEELETRFLEVINESR